MKTIEFFSILPTSTKPTQAERMAVGKEIASDTETDSGSGVMAFLSMSF